MSAPRTTSGVLAVVAAGLIATPASAADGAATNATTAVTPPTLTDVLDAVTTPKAAAPTTEAPAPAPAPTTTNAAPTTTATAPAPTKPAPTKPAPATTGTTPAKPSDPKDPSVGDDSGGQGRDNAKAARERRQRAAERDRVAKERREARADRREKRREARAKREAEAREARSAGEDAGGDANGAAAGGTTTAAGLTTSGLDADALLKAPTAVPNFFLDKFQIPPFLLPIYQAAGVQYGVRWEILAAINEIETNYGRNLNVSTAGALGWMQFMPPTWAAYGVDANGDEQADPYNPVDAIFAAARYLKAAGAETDIRKAIFAYNHADWYVDSVMMRARLISGLPTDLVGSLTGLTQGVFPVSGDATYAGAPKTDEPKDDDADDGSTALETTDDAADDASGKDTQGGKSGPRRSITIDAKAGSDAVAVQDGTVTALGESERLGRYVQLRDVFGNRYTYAHLDEVAETYPAPADDAPEGDAAATEALDVPKDPAPSAPATAGRQRRAGEDAKSTGSGSSRTDATSGDATSTDAKGTAKAGPGKADTVKHGALTEDGTAEATAPAAPTASAGPQLADKPLFANPRRDGSRWGTAERPATTAKTPAPGDLSATDPSATPPAAPKPAPATEEEQPVSREGLVDRPLKRGARVVGGTVLGTVGRKPDATKTETEPEEERAKMTFGVRPAGKGAPQVDPKPLLDGWKLLASTEVYRAKGENPLFGSGGSTASAGQVLLMSKAQLERRVLADDRLDIYPVGRQQIQAGQIDRRVLATLAFLSANGHRIGVSSLRRPGSITSAGNVSEHDSGNAIDISTVDGQVISAKTQGAGTVTERTIRLLLQLQGTMKPHQIISLMTASDFGGAGNILPLPDHADHIHVGFHVEDNGTAQLGQQLASALKPAQWDDLIAQLGKIENPDVPTKVSKYALKTKRAKKDK
ncbi:lytic murein transglycosylase [Patulibacter americanus]|uniref:lytic murein transglycosylase n=1 Tax=Patulibacter americanus TaxID=588672 RepID=UPI0003B7B758|nr:lytic murein transglycosylase [Patulibacter americanus]